MAAICAVLGDTNGVLLAKVTGEPDQTKAMNVTCEATPLQEERDGWFTRPCEWTGIAVVRIHHDSREAIWECPGCASENYVRYDRLELK